MKVNSRKVKSALRALQIAMGMEVTSYKGINVGDRVKDINQQCMHFGSIGVVTEIEPLPNNSGYLIHYTVENDGPSYSPGTVLTKTEDQLEKIS
jgi:hypothetical protein